jgi:hypothetical protein
VSLQPFLLAVVTLAGSGLLLTLGRDRWLDHVALALPTGVGLLVTISLVLVVSPVPYAAWLAIGVSVGIALAGVWHARRRGRLGAVGPAIGWSVVVVLVTPLVRRVRLTRVTSDSYEYLQVGGLLEALGGPSDDAHLVLARQLLVGAAHAPSWLVDEAFLVALAPLTAVSAVATVIWVVRVARPAVAIRWLDLAVLGAAGAAVLTANRTWFHAFYVNAHLLVGLYLAIVAAVPWLIARGALPRRFAVVAALAIVAIVVGRPEAPLLLLLTLVPVVVSPSMPRPPVAVLVGAYSGSILLWWAVAVRDVVDHGPGSPATVALLAAASLAVLHVVAVDPARRAVLQRFAPTVLIGGLLLGAIAAPILMGRVAVLRESLVATAENLGGAGLWGALPWTLPPLLVVAGSALRLRDGMLLWLPVAGFFPLALLLATARDGAYRVGPGDSLNRMWMHVLVLAVVTLVVTLLDGEERAWRPKPAPARAPR